MNYKMYRPIKACADKAASYISAGRETDRSFYNCFEWYGRYAVAVTLYRRAQKRPDTKLAQNLFKYLCRHALLKDVEEYKDWDDLEALGQHHKEEELKDA